MRIDKFTLKAQEAIQEGQTLARRSSHPNYEPEHLAKALLAQQDGVAPAVLRKIGADPRLAESRVDEALAKLPHFQGGEGATLSNRLL
ncbi:MAG TPA: Clp protease N-terminal domain-containing protein, partial [Myxococcaceae bacterium]|nr:Clp protease N-terminal domain-containing protein [Myxococcaceae bacterium]